MDAQSDKQSSFKCTRKLAIRMIILENEHFCLEVYVSEYSSFISYHLPAITNPAIKITISKIARRQYLYSNISYFFYFNFYNQAFDDILYDILK